MEKKLDSGFYQALFRLAPISISVSTLDDTIQDVNPQFSKFLGYDKAEVLGKTFSDFTHPDDKEASLKQHKEMVLGKIDHFDMEKRYLTKSGNWIWGHSVAVILKDESGNPDLVMAMQQDINDLKLAQEELKKHQEFLTSITENLTEGVLVVGKDGFLKYMNSTGKLFTGIDSTDKPLNEWAKSFGIYSADEITLLSLEDRPLLRALNGKAVYNMPLYVKQTASGEGRHIMVDAVPILDSEGEVASAMAVFRDVSDMKKAEDLVAEGTSRIRSLLESVPDMILRLDRKGRFQYVKDDSSGTFSFMPNDLLGTYIGDQFSDEDAALHMLNLQKAIESGELQHYNYELKVEEVQRFFEIRMMKASPEEVTVFIRDFTTTELREKDRMAKAQRLMGLIGAWPDLLFRLSSEGFILDYKAEKVEELLMPPEMFIGKNMKEILPPDLVELFTPMIAKAIKSNETQTVEYQVDVPAGILDYEARIVRINDSEVVFFGRNITDRKSQEKELGKAYSDLEEQAETLVALNTELEQYAYYAAHDIKGPMNNMRSLLDMLVTEDGVKPESKPLVEKMEMSLTEMKRIITALNDVLKMRKGLTVRSGASSISETIDQVLSGLSELIRGNGVNLTKKLNGDDNISMSPSHLHSVLQNLILNAIKYRDPAKGSEICIESKDVVNATIIEVTDNGMGFDQERIGNRVFEMFKRFHDHVPGNGIGLYLVRSIIESYNGTVKVSSNTGVGTNFVLTIPKE